MTRPRVTLFSVSALAIVAGCSTPVFDRDPELSRIGVDSDDLAAARSVNVPMPPPEVPRAPERGEQSSLWQRGSGGFFADQRATQVGDILTVMIEIDDQASLSNSTDRERSGSSEFTKPKFFGLETKLGAILPGGNSADPLVESSSATSASGKVSTSGR